MLASYLLRIQNARVYDVARATSLDFAPGLSRQLDNSIWLKREDQQPVFSFKLRGAYNKMVTLSREQLERGVVTASAGNHAQGVAFSARKLGTKAVIVMPVTTPLIKVNAVRNLGGEVILDGDNYDAAYERARLIERERGLTFVHPYDDPDVIAGQGTIGLEMLRQQPQLDTVFVAVGGGGLIGGIGAYIKAVRPDVKVIGVEPDDADAMYRSLRDGRRVLLPHVGIFADGVAVRQVGEETFRLAREVVDEIILVDTDAICAAIKDIFEETRTILEPAGALSVAGLKAYVEREKCRDRNLAAVASGANMNFDRLRHVSERAEIGEHRESVFAVTIPEEPGSFRRFCALIGNHSITEFNYRYADSRLAHVFVGVQVAAPADADRLMSDLHGHGYETVDMRANEMAKVHIRHMVGGRAPTAMHEALYRFEFPEKPGALMNFLNRMGGSWNISLFHYRNHGDNFGRVLIGMEVPPAEKADFQSFLDGLGYEYAEETDNPAYRMFLG